MGKLFEVITADLKNWIEQQKIFFVATAPLSEDGHVNCSPKGLDSFRVLDDTTVAYQDLTGSGIETISHIRENKRMVIMFCAFDGPPKIVRLHGDGEVVEPNNPEFENLGQLFPKRIGVRAYIKLHATRITDSCGYAVPKYDFVTDRDVLDKYSANKGEEGLKQYRLEKNQTSIDGLEGIR